MTLIWQLKSKRTGKVVWVGLEKPQEDYEDNSYFTATEDRLGKEWATALTLSRAMLTEVKKKRK